MRQAAGGAWAFLMGVGFGTAGHFFELAFLRKFA